MLNKLNGVTKALNNPAVKKGVNTVGDKLVNKLNEFDANSKDPNVNTVTGKANSKANDFKVDKALDKLPEGSFAKVSNIISKGQEKIK